MAELAAQREAEAKKQAELTRQREAEAQKQAEVTKQREAEARKQAEAAKKQQAELARLEVEQRKQADTSRAAGERAAAEKAAQAKAAADRAAADKAAEATRQAAAQKQAETERLARLEADRQAQAAAAEQRAAAEKAAAEKAAAEKAAAEKATAEKAAAERAAEAEELRRLEQQRGVSAYFGVRVGDTVERLTEALGNPTTLRAVGRYNAYTYLDPFATTPDAPRATYYVLKDSRKVQAIHVAATGEKAAEKTAAEKAAAEKAKLASATPAASAGGADALYSQAQALENEKKYPEAVRAYIQAARAGSGQAAKRLGDIYGKGAPGVTIDSTVIDQVVQLCAHARRGCRRGGEMRTVMARSRTCGGQSLGEVDLRGGAWSAHLASSEERGRTDRLQGGTMTDFLRQMRAAALRASGLAVALSCATAVLGADETAPVPKPEVKMGENWRFRVSIYQTNVPIVFSLDSRVSFVGPNIIVAVETGSDGRESDSQFDSEWGISSLGYVGQVFDPPIRFFKFPLQVGAEYPYAYGLAAQKGSPARTRAEGTVKVVGWEDVTVPAGKFAR